MKISEAIRLRKRGYSVKDISELAGITPQVVEENLKRAEKKGLWDGKTGVNEHDYDEYLAYAKNSKTIGSPLNRKEWDLIWAEVPKLKKPARVVNPDGTVKPLSKYRCLKCKLPLTPLEDIRFRNKDELKEQLLDAGFTHICLRCGIVVSRPKTSPLEEQKCERCGNELLRVNRGKEFVGYYCLNCKLFYEGELKGYVEKEETEKE